MSWGAEKAETPSFLSTNHYNVIAIDKENEEIEKAIHLAESNRSNVNFICADMRSFTSKKQYDIVYGYRVLHDLQPQERHFQINRYKDMTRKGGIHIFTVCVDKPFIPLPPDHDNDTVLYRSGELLGYYWDWELLYINEETVNCNSSGIHHQHVIDTVIAKKI